MTCSNWRRPEKIGMRDEPLSASRRLARSLSNELSQPKIASGGQMTIDRKSKKENDPLAEKTHGAGCVSGRLLRRNRTRGGFVSRPAPTNFEETKTRFTFDRSERFDTATD